MQWQTNERRALVNYAGLSLKTLNTDEYRHLKYLIFWPLFGLMFMFVERFYHVDTYYVMHCALDDVIPFNEFFIIPYFFWFVYLVGIHLYTLAYDTEAFKKLMRFIIFTYSAAMIMYLLFPTCQELRPAEFARDNIFTRFIPHFYQFDTNTNVCPSIHVIGSLAVLASAWNIERFKTVGWRIFFVTAAVLICVSTVFLKQHSIIDIIAALPICAAAYWVCYRRKSRPY